ncbi:RNA-binding domain-containing protein [Arcticibacter eurypsychrophilus]|uniref:RNA-binding domain-containing protein n=1 Tax=Arcticibacter eurypsychrophilus TaxID=1434752 RepID=UPI00084D1BDC|nr:RNA-binding domain-containing protein [Arcticibacter eurypsychrophilus]
MTETNRIEFKQELTDSLEKEVIAFLNYKEGGIIYIGINNEGIPVGVADFDGDQLKIKDRLKHNIAPSCMGLFDVVSEQNDNLNTIKIIVASGSEKPYFLKKYGMTEKGSFVRVGSASEPMPQRLIEDLFARRTRNSIGKIKSNQQKLNFEQLKIYYEAVSKKLNDKFAANLELLNTDEQYNYVAYLLSDSNNISIKLAKYKGTSRVNLIESNDYGGESLIKATKQVLDKIDLENKTLTQITSKERKEIRLWDPIALREAIINAFVHNDYTSEVPPKFELFDDRIEITSTGSLPEGLSQEEFFDGFSVPRNKEIMRIYKDLDLVEQLGSGVPRILESYDKQCFKFSDHFLRMSFPIFSNEVDGHVIGELGGGAIGGAMGGAIGGAIDLTDRQQEVLAIIKSNRGVSYRAIAGLLKINESAVLKHIEILKERGYIVRVGGTRGYWKV